VSTPEGTSVKNALLTESQAATLLFFGDLMKSAVIRFFIIFWLRFLIVFLLGLVSVVTLVKHHRGNNLHPVESGFIGYSGGFTPFSIHFFLILLIFVLFDVEIIFMVLVPSSSIEDLVGLAILLFFIYGTLFYEWKISKLIWF
jgi:NADH:ubiquinone oxidoreductase subunit 3 (subunit A)